MKPSELKVLTDNDILEAIHFKRAERKLQIADMKTQAWYNWMCSTNRPMFGQENFKFTPFDELFPEYVPPKPKTDPAKLKEVFTAHKINLL